MLEYTILSSIFGHLNFLCMALFHHEKSCKQWFPVLKINYCGQLCGGLPFLGLVPRGASLQCKTEVEIKLVVLTCKPKLFRACKMNLSAISAISTWIWKGFLLPWTWKFRWCFGFFYSRQELHDSVMQLLCLCVEVIFMDDSLHSFGKYLVSRGAPVLTCRLSGHVEILSRGGMPCFSSVLWCLNFPSELGLLGGPGISRLSK